MPSVRQQTRKIKRRTLLGAIAATPLAALPATAKSDTTEQRLAALIEELENAPDYETCSTHWAKAWAAAEIRKILEMPVPDSKSLKAYFHQLEEQKEIGRKYDALMAQKALKTEGLVA